jgi:hypothetical protein
MGIFDPRKLKLLSAALHREVTVSRSAVLVFGSVVLEDQRGVQIVELEESRIM